jgi:hypothetical protein
MYPPLNTQRIARNLLGERRLRPEADVGAAALFFFVAPTLLPKLRAEAWLIG